MSSATHHLSRRPPATCIHSPVHCIHSPAPTNYLDCGAFCCLCSHRVCCPASLACCSDKSRLLLGPQGTTAGTSCPQGSYCLGLVKDANRAAPTSCSTIFSPAADKPSTLPFTSPLRSSTVEACVCKAGRYMAVSTTTQPPNSCELCLIGSYTDTDSRATECTFCDSDEIAAAPGSTACTKCPAGTFASWAGSTCVDKQWQLWSMGDDTNEEFMPAYVGEQGKVSYS